MSGQVVEDQWRQLAEEALSGMSGWRMAHPSATLAEIEAETDRRLAGLRARMIQDAAQVSAAADVKAQRERVICPHCATPVRVEGQHKRRLKTTHDTATRFAPSLIPCIIRATTRGAIARCPAPPRLL
ncbi:MAG: hypothetical protein ACRDIB_02540 [Ardenticatenaceae bacterium]